MRHLWIPALLIATGSVLFGQEAPPADEEAGVRLFKKVDPAVVAIKHEAAGGSGFIITPDGYILTNGHVISGFNGAEEDPRIVAKRITVVLHDETKLKARVIGHSLDPDIALIKVDPETSLQCVELADSEKVNVGQRAYAFGMPFGMKRTLTAGIVSNSGRADLGTFTKVIQTDAPINPGNSGGPLFNETGEVLGLNTYGGFGDGMGFTVPINVAKIMKEHFLSHGRFRRAAIPFMVCSEINEDLGKALGGETGVIVNFVAPGTAAEKAGLRSGDIIVKMNDDAVAAKTRTEFLDFRWKLCTLGIGDTVRFGIKRPRKDGYEERTIEAVLEEDEPALEGGFQIGEIPELRYEDLGIGLKPLTLGTYFRFNLPRIPGVRLTRVMGNSPARKAGLRHGDLVTHVGEAPVEDIAGFRAELEKQLKAHEELIRITVRRGHQETDLLRTAIRPFYDLKDRKVLMVVPSREVDHFDVIHRFLVTNGTEIVIASDAREIVPEKGKSVPADRLLSDLNGVDFDGILLLGGEGARELWNNEPLQQVVRKGFAEKKIVGAIGTGSITLLNDREGMKDRKMTTDPDAATEALDRKADYTGNDVEHDGLVITSTGDGSDKVMEFLRLFRTLVQLDD